MTSPFQPKSVQVPGLLTDDAFQEQLKQFAAGKNAQQNAAPPPNSAVDFADRIGNEFLKPGALPGMVKSPSLQKQDRAIEVRSDILSDLAPDEQTFGSQYLRSVLLGPIVGTFGEGGLADKFLFDPRERQEEAERQLEQAQEDEAATAAAVDARKKLRTDAQQNALDLGFSGDLLAADEIDELNAQEDQRNVEAAKTTAEKAKAVDTPELQPTMPWWLNVVREGYKSTAGMPLGTAKGGIALWELGPGRFLNGGDLERSNMRAWVDTVEQTLDKMMPGDKARSKDFVTQLAQGGGSMMGFMIGGFVGNALGLPAGSVPAIMGALTSGSEGLEDAERYNAVGVQKYIAFFANAALGVTEAIPIDRMFMRAEQATGGLVSRMLANTVAGGLEEFIQEFAQAAGQDVVAKWTYDAQRELSVDKWATQGVIGFLTGGLGGAAVQILSEAGVAGPPPETPIDDAAREEAAQTVIDVLQDRFDQSVTEDRPDIALSAEEAADAILKGETVPEGFVRVNEDGTFTEAGGETFEAGQQPEPATETLQPEAADERLAAVDAAERVEPVVEGPGGTIPVNENGKLELRHYSHEVLTDIDPSMRGTGPLRGKERDRLGPPGSGDPNVVDRAYFGTGTPPTAADVNEFQRELQRIDKMKAKSVRDPETGTWFHPKKAAYDAVRRRLIDTKGYAPEAGLGKYKHIVEADPATIYNAWEDPLGLRAQLDAELTSPERTTQFERLVRDAGFKGLYYSESELGQVVLMFDKTKPARVIDDRFDLPLDEIATKEDIAKLDKKFFQSKGGWAILTGTQERLGPADSELNVKQNEKLRKELIRSGVEFEEVGGSYQGVDQGASFLVFMPEREALDLAQRYKQESILTRKGLEYSDGRLVPAVPEETVVGPEAKELDFYSSLPDGTAFSVGLDFGGMVEPDTFARVGDPLSPEAQQELVNTVSGLKHVLPNLTPEEQARVRATNAQKLVDMVEKLPSAEEMAAVAFSGRAKRGWYRRSAQALVDIFGIEDAPRFSALLAALSPQTSVETNTKNALNIWAAWKRAGRPTDAKGVKRAISAGLMGGKVLPAWVNNSVEALTNPDVNAIRLSGPKVSSFMLNLNDVTHEVTNDAWMTNYAGVSETFVQGQSRKLKNDPYGRKTFAEKSLGYIAMSSVVRRAAEVASDMTGEKWTPSEIQETVWSWAKTLYETAYSRQDQKFSAETANKRLNGVTAEQVLAAGGLTAEDISSTPDFATLFVSGVYRNILERGGYDLSRLDGSDKQHDGRGAGGRDPLSTEGTRFDRGSFEQHLRRAAQRLDALSAARQAEAGQSRAAQEEEVAPSYSDEDVDDFLASVAPAAEDLKPLPGLTTSKGPIASVVQAARAYAASRGMPVRRQSEYVKVDVERAKRIAKAYDEMKHAPDDPAVKAAYQAMIDETLAQYQFVKATGLVIEAIEPGQADPYTGGPKEVLEDLERGHLWFYPTESGFGSSDADTSGNPLLAPTNEKIGDRVLLANDVFRIVHDFFGHGIEGSGFGARGEENAWQSHMRLYSEAALPAVTSETRGQNSWVNYGPYGEQNRANQRETVYADQKTGIMPEWTWREGVADDETFASTSAARGPYKAEQSRPDQGIPTPAGQQAGGEKMDLSLNRITQNLAKIMDLTLRQGRISMTARDSFGNKQEVMGEYNRRQDVARVRSKSDLSTAVHEAGHALYFGANDPLKQFITGNDTKLMKAAKDLYGGDTNIMPKSTQIAEGFAEFFRVYVLNRKYAQRNYPDLTQQFDDLLTTHDKKLKDGLEIIAQQYMAYLQLPSAQVISNMIVSGRRDGAIDTAMKELREVGFKTWFHEYARGVVEHTVNRFAPLDDLVTQINNIANKNTGKALDLKRADDPRALIRLAQNFGARAHIQLTDGVMGYRSVNPETRSLRDALLLSQGRRTDQNIGRIDPVRQQDFAAYLVALRLVDEFRRLDEGKIERPPVDDATLGDAKLTIDEMNAKYKEFAEAAKIVHEYSMGLWKKAYDAGLMTKETYQDGLDRQFYAPLQRDMSDKRANYGEGPLTGGQRFVKRFKGSGRDIIDPMDILMHKTYALEQIIARNDVMKTLASLADRAGKSGALVERVPATKMIGTQLSVRDAARQLLNDENITEADAADLMLILEATIKDDKQLVAFRASQASAMGDNMVFFWENGKLAALQLADGDLGADIVNVVNGLGRENLPLFADLIAGTSTAFRSAITLWPDFLFVNFIRDQMSAFILTRGYKPFWTGLKGVGDELRQRQWAKHYNAAMGMMGGMNVASLHEARVTRDINALRKQGYIANVFRADGVLDGIRNAARLAELTETGSRLGIFRTSYERAKADGLNDWEASIEASYEAVDYMNFGLNGSRMLLFRRTIPFLNAQLQGLYKMMRTLGADEVRQRKGIRFVLSSYFKSINGLDLSRTEKQALSKGRAAWVKMASLGLISALLHFLFEDDPDYQEASEYLRTTGWVIPLGEGRLAYIPKPFELAVLANFTERAFEAASGDSTALKERFVRGFAMTMTPPTAPPILQSLVEYAANKDFFSGREIVPSYMQALSPELQFNNYTTAFAKQVGEITGWSPMVIDHFMSSLGASAYRDLTNVYNALDPARPTMDMTDAPLTRRFVRDVRRGSTSSQDFWKQASTLNGTLRTAEMTYRNYLEAGNEQAANAFLDTLDEDARAYALLNAHFKVEYKRLNPFYRTRQINTIVSAMRRELVTDLGLDDTTVKGSRDTIKLSRKEKADIDTALSEYARREMRNTLIAMREPGWYGKRPLRTDTTINMIEAIDPRVRDELERRIAKAKVYNADVVYEYWPEVQNRLISDRENTFLDDVLAIAKAVR